MRVTPIIISLCAFVSFKVSGQTQLPERPLNHLKEFRLNGNVKSFKVTPYQAVDSFGIILKGKKLESWTGDDISFFNEKGYRTESDKYSIAGKLQYKTIIRRNDKNQRTSRDIYDPNGKIRMRYVYVYDGKGYKIAYNHYSINGKLMESWQYINDEQGREKEVIYTNRMVNPPQSRKFNYQWNRANSISSITEINNGANSNNTWKYTYDSQKRITSLEVFQNDSLMYKLVIDYDSKGNEHQIRKYNESGEFVEEREYKYTLDSKGNWIERIEYVNMFPRAIYVRDIEYY